MIMMKQEKLEHKTYVASGMYDAWSTIYMYMYAHVYIV